MPQQIKLSAKKKQLIKERTVLSKESQKSENKMHGKDQKKVFIVGDSMINNITGTEISREVLQLLIYAIILHQNFGKNLM